MKPKLLLLMLFGTALAAETHVSIGIGVGVPVYYPPPPPVVAYVPPPCPGPGYIWIAGFWYPTGSKYSWRPGYWARPPYAGARWVAPRYHKKHYYAGYWEGPGRHHNERWDRGRGKAHGPNRYGHGYVRHSKNKGRR